MAQCDRFYFDCDGAGTWEKLKRALKKAGIPAIFHESSSSVKRRMDGDESLPLKWHVEIPLAKTLANPLHGLDLSGPEARYARREWKRRYHHVAAVLSALAGFSGIGSVRGAESACGFDATTSQMCAIRFLGARQHELGVPAAMVFLEGDKALDWDAFLCETGYEASEFMPNPAIKKIKVHGPTGVKDWEYSDASDQLDADIRGQISVRQFLAAFCGYGSAHSGEGHYLCPAHHETENKRSLHVYNADVLGGQEMWKCFGDCDTSGDVIRLAQLTWGCTRWQARGRLADYIGVDPADYRSKRIGGESLLPPRENLPPVGAQLPPRENLPPVAVEKPLSSGSKKKAPKRAPDGLPFTSKWAKKWLVRYGETQGFTRAVTKVMLMCGAGSSEVKGGDGKPTKVVDLAVVASTLWPMAGDYYRKYDSLLADVVSVQGRIQAKEPTTGVTKMRERLGSQGMFELAKALRRDGCEFKECLKILVGFGLTRGAQKKWLDGLWRWFKAHPAENPWDAEKQTVEHKKWKKRYDRFMNALRRPGGCKQCVQIVTGAGGRNLGPTGPDGEATRLKRQMVCVAKTCLYCFMLKAVTEMELLEEMWAERGEEKIYVVEAKGIESPDHLEVIKAKVSKQSDPKLGITGWGDDGKPTLSYFVTNREAARVVRSAIIMGGYTACGKRLDVTQRLCKTAREAIDTAIAARLSFNVRVKHLIETGQAEELSAWLWWAVYKSPVKNPKNKAALPWPTKDEIQDHVRSRDGEAYEPDLYPGEVLTYTLEHAATGIFLGRRRKLPFSFDQALDAMDVNQSVRNATAAVGGAATAAA
jgi:hypothetical protein